MDARTYRAAPGAYALPGTIAGVTSVLWLIAIWRLNAPGWPLLVPLGAFAVLAVRLSRFRLTFGAQEILLVAPRQPVRCVALADILSIEFRAESGGDESSSLLCIRTSSGEELHLDAHVFPTVAVQRLLALAPRPGGPERASRSALARTGFRARPTQTRSVG